jgi:hypothetical protein
MGDISELNLVPSISVYFYQSYKKCKID